MALAAVDSFDNVLTTNYSFEIEQALGIKNSVHLFRRISHQTISGLTERQRSSNIYKYHEVKDKRIWHIHGDAAALSSWMMEQLNAYKPYLYDESEIKGYETLIGMIRERQYKFFIRHLW